MATMLRLRKRHGAYVVDGAGTPTASLEFGRSMRRGTVTVNGTALPIEVDNPLRVGVTLGGDAPVLRLAPDEAYVPGSRGQVRWRATRSFRGGYQASLVRGSDTVEFSLPRFRGKSVEVSVRGDWEELELVALAGCFALLTLRRGDAFRAAVVASAASQHPR